MIRMPYKYVDSKLVPDMSFISKSLGIGFAASILMGIGSLLSGFGLGLVLIPIGIILYFVSDAYNKKVELAIEDILENHKEIAVKVYYEQEIEKVRNQFTSKQISSEEFDKLKKQLEKEMVREIRRYKPDYNLGDKLEYKPKKKG